MDKLWAPWRIKYITAKKQKGCIFCDHSKSRTFLKVRDKSKQKNYVLFKTSYSICMLNIFPYNNGHLMVSPLRHLKDFSKLKEAETLDLFKSLSKAQNMLERVLKPEGYNIGINISSIAGAGITGHLHVHIVPRWKGDTNFMPVLYDTKIISESLDELYKQLKKVTKC